MSRPFEIVERKVLEAEFFLQKLGASRRDLFARQCYFNAFVSSARSITFCLQASLASADGFDQWYEKQVRELSATSEARFFNWIRSKIQHAGWQPVIAMTFRRNSRGQHILDKDYFIQHPWEEFPGRVPVVHLELACEQHLKRLLKIAYNCYRKFFHLVDSRGYYSIEGLRKNHKSIEDLEEELGIPRGWTDLRITKIGNKYSVGKGKFLNVESQGNIDERLRVLRRHVQPCQTDVLFFKILKRYKILRR